MLVHHTLSLVLPLICNIIMSHTAYPSPHVSGFPLGIYMLMKYLEILYLEVRIRLWNQNWF